MNGYAAFMVTLGLLALGYLAWELLEKGKKEKQHDHVTA